MDLEGRVSLVTRNIEETVTYNELRTLLDTTSKPRAYWGFECSGMMHLGMGLVCGRKIKDMLEAGFEFIIFLADWHSFINNKLGGKMENIKICGEYFKECFTGIGIDPEKVKYVWASELAGDSGYWEKVIRIAKSATLNRVLRALPIMGRSLTEAEVEAATIIYPCMQAADIFHMDLDVACAGIDQRKAHMLAREAADKYGWKKPICIHTPLLTGLTGPVEDSGGRFDEDKSLSTIIGSKMSKSIPGSSILVHDQPDDIRMKIRNAFCPPKESKGNPVMEIVKYIIMPEKGEIKIPRPKKYGGETTFTDYTLLELEYRKGIIHPLDLKNGVAEELVKILEGVRIHFKENPKLLDEMKRIDITR
ncbi:MAG: tyrosine--tRNA ligase [Candidatus Bathyarchaeia archaeon]